MDKNYLKSVNTEIFEIEKSKFIAVLQPLDSFDDHKSLLNKLKTEYTGATHYTYALIFDEKVKASDDGEPSGTAGRPLLQLLEKKKINRVILVVIRYFGGTKLGAGRLLRSYLDAGTLVIGSATLIKKIPACLYKITIKASNLRLFEKILSIKQTTITNKEYNGEVINIYFKAPQTLDVKNLINMEYQIINSELFIEESCEEV